MYSNRTLVFTGFWYSGSSAPKDYIMEFSNTLCFSLPPHMEPRLICSAHEQALGTIADLMRAQGTLGERAAPEEMADSFYQICLGDNEDDFNNKMNLSLRRRLGHEFDILIEGMADFISKMRSDTTYEAYCFKCREFFSEAFKLIPGWTEEASIIIDNDPPSMHGNVRNALDLYPNARVVAAFRDPRDMFFEVTRFQPNQVGRDSRGMEKWFNMIIPALKRFSRSIDKERVIVLWFEEFVRRDDLKEELRKFLDLSGTRSTGTYFKPEQSVLNIGVYRDMDSQLVKPIEDTVRPIMEEIKSSLD